ncbi:MAG: hypothetical protein HY060_19160 [Proteobacteria bacterium]|nr:hypothetical protein [Pseudomonadota bacterium]
MASKLGIKHHERATSTPAADAARGGRRLYRLGGNWAVGVNWKLVRALGLAALAWALILAVVLSM